MWNLATLALAAMTSAPQSCSATKASTQACASSMQLATQKSDIVATAIAAGDFETLVTAVKAAELVEVLQSPGPFTVFAPADSAFAKVPKADLSALLADKKALAEVLTYHVVPGKLMASDVLAAGWLDTVQGQSLRVNKKDGKPRIDDAAIVKTDIECANGVIHVIDSVVKPRPNLVQAAQTNGSFQTLLKAATAAGLVDTLSSEGPFTLFAPSDEAFAKIPAADLNAILADKEKLKAILTYHVVPGRVLSTDLADQADLAVKSVQGASLHVRRNDANVVVDQARVVVADLIVGNGVIHVVDQVLLPKDAST